MTKGSFRGMAGHLIRRLHQHSTQVFSTRLRSSGIDLTPVQYAALEAIAEQPGLDQAGVAAAIAYDRATIGGVLDRLVAKGHVARAVSSSDRRARVLTLTEQGQALIAEVRPLVESVQPDILCGLDDDERRLFLALAAKATRTI